MKALFLKFSERGAMTLTELASVLRMKVDFVRRKAQRGEIPRIPGTGRQYRFDPLKMIEVFCEPPKQDRSLTSEKRESGGNQHSRGGFRKCL